jgi:cholesterol oxidase
VAGAEHFDAVVVGSGFGGSVSTYRLADAGYNVLLLERGKPYPPGSFPRAPYDVNRNFWDPSAGGHGLYQAWSFPGIESVVSAGLGGGSLIYANVLLRKDEKWFVKEDPNQPGFEYWPVDRQTLDPHYDRVEKVLKPQVYPFDKIPYLSTQKTIAYRDAAKAAKLKWELPPLAVTFANPGDEPIPGEPIKEEPNFHQRTRYTCRLVGECDAGCNYGSKNSLDYNYITLAAKAGAQIRTLCEVRSFGPCEGGGFWIKYVEHTEEHEYHPFDTSSLTEVEVTADRLVISSGVFGSTYLLLKNKVNFPNMSAALGTHFSGNGDLLGFVRNVNHRNLAPTYGPVITSTIRVGDELDGDGSTGRGFYIQEGGFPAFGAWAIETSDTPGMAIRALQFALRRVEETLEGNPKSDLGGELRHFLGDAHTSAGTMVMLGMGRDMPNGNFSLQKKWLQLDWNRDASAGYFDRVKATMLEIAKDLGGEFTVNPLDHFSKTVTVHGLGGCPMGRNENEGVVDSFGRVFNYPGLFVADGSVLPGPVGPNPSLTIAAVADRFADEITNKTISAAAASP